MNRLLNELRSIGEVGRLINTDILAFDKARRAMDLENPHWDEGDKMIFHRECVFAGEWTLGGEIVYTLSHSLAAMFAMTSAPVIDWDHMPHKAFVVQVPRGYLPLKGTIEPEFSYIYVSHRQMLIVSDWDTLALQASFNGDELNIETFDVGKAREQARTFDPSAHDRQEAHAIVLRRIQAHPQLSQLPPDMQERLATETVQKDIEQVRARAESTSLDVRESKGLLVLTGRFVANLMAYLEQEPTGTVVRRASSEQAGTVVEMKPPRDVVINRAFRDAARDVVTSTMEGSVVGLRRAMAHHVRGHYRNQPVGQGRTQVKRIWIHPHRRGDAKFGSVVRRVEELDVTMSPRAN